MKMIKINMNPYCNDDYDDDDDDMGRPCRDHVPTHSSHSPH